MYEGGDRVLEAIQWANSSSRFTVHVKNVKYINNSYLNFYFVGKMKLFNNCAYAEAYAGMRYIMR